MKVTIVAGADEADNHVIVDGVQKVFSLAGLLPDNVWAVQWDGAVGEIEYRDGSVETIDNLDSFSQVVTAWENSQ